MSKAINPKKGMTSQDFGAVLAEAESHYPISDALEKEMPQKKKRYWFSSRLHVSAFFEAKMCEIEAQKDAAKKLGKKGAFPTKKRENLAYAFYAFQGLQRPEAIIWMYEALDLDEAIIQETAETLHHMHTAGLKPSKLAKFARGAFEWDVIEAAALAKHEELVQQSIENGLPHYSFAKEYAPESDENAAEEGNTEAEEISNAENSSAKNSTESAE